MNFEIANTDFVKREINVWFLETRCRYESSARFFTSCPFVNEITEIKCELYAPQARNDSANLAGPPLSGGKIPVTIANSFL